MGFDIGASMSDLVNRSSAPHGVSEPRPVRPVTDLSPHVDGGPDSTRGSNKVSDADARKNLWDAAAIVIAAVLFLWLSGALVFRSHNV